MTNQTEAMDKLIAMDADLYEVPAAQFEVSFRPAKRRVGGVHQPDVSYILTAESRLQATTRALRMIEVEHPGYLHTKTRELVA